MKLYQLTLTAILSGLTINPTNQNELLQALVANKMPIARASIICSQPSFLPCVNYWEIMAYTEFKTWLIVKRIK